jgi:hypothetical protein
VGEEFIEDRYHISVTRQFLGRNLAGYVPEVRDEILLAFEDVLSLQGNGCTTFFLSSYTNMTYTRNRMEEHIRKDGTLGRGLSHK